MPVMRAETMQFVCDNVVIVVFTGGSVNCPYLFNLYECHPALRAFPQFVLHHFGVHDTCVFLVCWFKSLGETRRRTNRDTEKKYNKFLQFDYCWLKIGLACGNSCTSGLTAW